MNCHFFLKKLPEIANYLHLYKYSKNVVSLLQITYKEVVHELGGGQRGQRFCDKST